MGVAVTTPSNISSSSLQISSHGGSSYDTSTVTAVQIHSLFDATCPFANTRRKRDGEDDLALVDARGYKVAVSNDGSNFSPDMTVVVFDSSCQSCEIVNEEVSCIFTVRHLTLSGRMKL